MLLSAILPAWDTFESIRAVLSHLGRQTIASQMEVVFVCPEAASFAVDSAAIAQFQAHQVIEIGTIDTRSRAFAEGIRAARASLVVLCEDHCFPVPEWAEALVQRHQSGTYAAVGPMFGNANPENSISDVDLLMAYGPFLQGLPGGKATFIPGHNSCYRREILISHDHLKPTAASDRAQTDGDGSTGSAGIPAGQSATLTPNDLREAPHLDSSTSALTRRTPDDSLARLLEAEYVFHQRLSSEGHQLYVEPRARVFHMNFATWSAALHANFLAARLFGSVRAQSWPVSRRLIFTFAAMAVPLIRARRILPAARRAGWSLSHVLKVTPALMVVLYANAAGEWLGNLQGRRTKTPDLVHYEFHRYRFSPTLKRQQLASTLHFK